MLMSISRNSVHFFLCKIINMHSKLCILVAGNYDNDFANTNVNVLV